MAAIGATVAIWCFHAGYTLYYGDAEAHLNIARRVLDSRTPGPEQLGTVWLPLPHLLMIPFVMHGDWWKTGVAGIIPSCACFALAAAFLFAALRRLFDSTAAGFAAAFLFALNPNALYLQSIPMTESVFFLTLTALLWATVWYRDSKSLVAVLFAGAASCAASLTRYEGWALIPLVCLYFAVVSKRKWHAILFAGIAALAPLAWLAHNWFYLGHALEFYDGPYSAMAIYARSRAAGMRPAPGDHDWLKTLEMYLVAARMVAGAPLAVIGLVGCLAALWKREWWPLLLLSIPPLFYVASIHSGGTPIYLPDRWPNSYYNTRYALAVLPLLAVGGGALVILAPARWRNPLALVIPAIVAVGWSLPRTAPLSICWKESEVNSVERRAWTREAADYLAANYHPGDGILFSFGDLTGVLREAGIPLREGLHEGNHPAWEEAIGRPQFFLHEEWALAFSRDSVATAAGRADRRGIHYSLEEQIMIRGAPVVEIYRRSR